MRNFFAFFVPTETSFQKLIAGSPFFLWLNQLSEFTMAAAFFIMAIGAVYFSRGKDRQLQVLFCVPALFFALFGLTRVMSLVVTWQPLFEHLIFIKGATAITCILSAFVIYPNLKRINRLATLEESEKILIELEKEMVIRKEMEEKLQLYAQMLSSSSEGFLAVREADLKIAHANPAFEAMFGYAPGELLEKHCSVLISGESDQIVQSVRQDLKRDSVWRRELLMIRKDGSRFWVNFGLRELKQSRYGKLWVSVGTDMTQHRKDQEQISEQQAKLSASAKMAALGEMAAGIGHEINNPLATIQATAEDIQELIQEGRITPAEISSRLAAVERTSNRISRIIRGLRTFAREDEGTEKSRASLHEIFMDTLFLCKERFHSKGIELRMGAMPNNLDVFCRPVQISQVLLNLLNNSFDAVCELPEKWVSVEVDVSPESIQVHVTDSGRGIPIEIQGKIMQPFFSTKEIGRGSGLGLSISKGIAENHNGTLMYHLRDGHTCFTLTIPNELNIDGIMGPEIPGKSVTGA